MRNRTIAALLTLAFVALAGAAFGATTDVPLVIKTKNASYTVLATDDIILLEPASAITMTLPAASTVATTHPITFKSNRLVGQDVGTYQVAYKNKILPDGSDTIDGATAFWFWDEVTLWSDGVSAWRSSINLGSASVAAGVTTLAVSSTSAFTGASTFAADVTASGADTDVTLSADTSGGNAGARNEFIGLPRIKMVALGTGTNPGTDTKALMDDSSAGEFAPVDADVTEAEGSVAGIYRIGSSSYRANFLSTATEDDGFVDAGLGGAGSWEALESVGMWIYSSVALAAGDLQLVLTDDGGARKFNIPAVATASKWTWVEIDITALDAGTGDNISDVAITLTAAGATAQGAFTVYVDGGFGWDSVDEEALGAAVQTDGVLSVMSVLTAGAGDNTPLLRVDQTDYFVHYESGNDFIVWVTDQSSTSSMVLIAY